MSINIETKRILKEIKKRKADGVMIAGRIKDMVKKDLEGIGYEVWSFGGITEITERRDKK